MPSTKMTKKEQKDFSKKQRMEKRKSKDKGRKSTTDSSRLGDESGVDGVQEMDVTTLNEQSKKWKKNTLHGFLKFTYLYFSLLFPKQFQ